MLNVEQCVVGYDPGGNGKHGVAALHLSNGNPTHMETATLSTAEAVINFIALVPNVSAVGIDTLTCWCTGSGGWRPADRFLRRKYPNIAQSVVTPNGLYGAMGLNGPAVLKQCLASNRELMVTETHPKVLYWHLTGRPYDFGVDRVEMDALLAGSLGIEVVTATDHAWDAALSAFAAYKGLLGCWTMDLHKIPCEPNERLVWPCDPTHYFWPSEVAKLSRAQSLTATASPP